MTFNAHAAPSLLGPSLRLEDPLTLTRINAPLGQHGKLNSESASHIETKAAWIPVLNLINDPPYNSYGIYSPENRHLRKGLQYTGPSSILRL